ncbi:MAG: hypothetical protein H6Q73_1125, partial [Firmicutes bacterium]|nr:hypothetical protein [Bacillota bacterium]
MNDRHRTIDRLRKKYKNIAAGVLAGAAIMSSVILSPVAGAAPQNAAQHESTKPPTKYEQVIDIKATAYAPGAHDNDQWGNKTFLGTQVRPGIIAVDPKVIPLGSKVYIEYP